MRQAVPLTIILQESRFSIVRFLFGVYRHLLFIFYLISENFPNGFSIRVVCLVPDCSVSRMIDRTGCTVPVGASTTHTHTRSLNTMPSFMSIFGEVQLVPCVVVVVVSPSGTNASRYVLECKNAPVRQSGRPIPNSSRVLILTDINLCMSAPGITF